jgi:hypothetical protein
MGADIDVDVGKSLDQYLVEAALANDTPRACNVRAEVDP